MKKSKFLLVAITSSLISSAQSADFNEEFKKDLKSTRSSVSTGIDFNEKDQSNIYKESISNLHIQSKADIGVSGLKGLILNNYEPAILTLASLYKLGELIDQDLDKSIILYKKLPKNPDNDAVILFLLYCVNNLYFKLKKVFELYCKNFLFLSI